MLQPRLVTGYRWRQLLQCLLVFVTALSGGGHAMTDAQIKELRLPILPSNAILHDPF